MASIPTIALVGIHGHGDSHVRRALELQREGRAHVRAVVDPRPPLPDQAGHEAVAAGAAWVPSLDDVLGDAPDVVVLCTPIPTHLPFAQAAMEAGADVLLEKPTAASAADHRAIVAVAERTGRLCQVGFQTFGSAALDAVARLVADGAVGQVTGYGAVGTWVRTTGYWSRAAWAGRRRLDGVDVVDGVVTNPLAHAVATALRVAGATRSDDVATVELDLHRANPIEADDTSSGRVVTARGARVGFGLTLCAAERAPARVLVLGTAGEVELAYETDHVTVRDAAGAVVSTSEHGRTHLLDDLLAARAGDGRLRCDVRDTGAFMAVLEAVRSGPEPSPLAPEHIVWHGDGADRHAVVTDVDRWCERAARSQRTFRELGAPFARPRTGEGPNGSSVSVDSVGS